MKFYYRKDHPLVSRHKKLIKWGQEKTKLSDYQLLWLSFAKGILLGALLL